MFPFRNRVKELQKTIATLEETIADNRHVTWKQYVQLQEAEKARQRLAEQLDTAWKTIQGNEEQFKLIKQEQAMNAQKPTTLGDLICGQDPRMEISGLRGEISILKEELQRLKIVAEQEKNRADAHSDSFADLQEELETTIKQRDALDKEINRLHAKYFQQGVELKREHLPGAPAHCKEKTGIDAILAEREKTHGSFETHANCTQLLEDTFYCFKPSHFYNSVMREGLHMIFHKLGRIAAGCATHKDHWDDIAGYATLVSRSLEKLEKE